MSGSNAVCGGGPGIVGLWHFDEIYTDGEGVQTTQDSSGQYNTGTLMPSGSEPMLVDGKFGNALDFDGVDDYVSVLDSNSLDCSSAITIEAWIYLENYPSTQSGSILSKRWAYYFVLSPDGKLKAYTYGTTPQAWFSSVNSVPLNEWVHVAFTYDGGAIKIYINGELDVSSLRTGAITITDQWAAIGRVGIKGGAEIICCGARAFNGIIDEARIWNVALTAGQVKASYDLGNGTQIKEKDLDDDGDLDVIFTSAFYELEDGETITLTMLPVDPSVSIAWVMNHRVTPKRTFGDITPGEVSASGYSVPVTVDNQEPPCKSIHMWLWLNTGDHVGINAQFER